MNILLNGATGRMGREVAMAAKKQEVLKIVCGLDRENTEVEGFPVYANPEDIQEKIDVIIDFSIPKATFKMLSYAQKEKIPVVIATTGFSQEELQEIEKISHEIPIFRSANMSVDINLMASIVKKVAEVLQDSDIEIVETHHNRKIDSPSGTAILLADAINEVFEEKKKYDFERMQKREKRKKEEIGFSSIRGGNIVGEHSVKFFGENEMLEITHKAYSRQLFAEGALRAANFIYQQKPGFYNMKDLVQ